MCSVSGRPLQAAKLVYTDQAHQSFEMGYSRKEFETLLKQQSQFGFQELAGSVFDLDWDGALARVTLGVEATRQIASMVISKLEVTMDLSALDCHQRKTFLATFFKTFLKGGG